jgi:hypothetical protein
MQDKLTVQPQISMLAVAAYVYADCAHLHIDASALAVRGFGASR